METQKELDEHNESKSNKIPIDTYWLVIDLLIVSRHLDVSQLCFCWIITFCHFTTKEKKKPNRNTGKDVETKNIENTKWEREREREKKHTSQK